MATKKTSDASTIPPAPAGRRKGVPKEKVLVRLEPHQARALREEAFRRAQERGKGQPDASEVLRELVQAWIDRRSR